MIALSDPPYLGKAHVRTAADRPGTQTSPCRTSLACIRSLEDSVHRICKGELPLPPWCAAWWTAVCEGILWWLA